MNNKILILSEDVVLKRKYTEELAKAGFTVAEASDVLDGVLTATKHSFDIVIIDEEICSDDSRRQFSKIRNYSSAHIILLGKNPISELPDEDVGQGFDAYFQKSTNTKELITYIKGIVNQPIPLKNTESFAGGLSVDSEISSRTDSILSVVDSLEEQVARIKVVMSGLDKMQKQVTEAENMIRQQQEAFEIVINKLTEINKYLDSVTGSSK
jgi:DNA-binding response OmpR family regulator